MVAMSLSPGSTCKRGLPRSRRSTKVIPRNRTERRRSGDAAHTGRCGVRRSTAQTMLRYQSRAIEREGTAASSGRRKPSRVAPARCNVGMRSSPHRAARRAADHNRVTSLAEPRGTNDDRQIECASMAASAGDGAAGSALLVGIASRSVPGQNRWPMVRRRHLFASDVLLRARPRPGRALPAIASKRSRS
jgi:hypothetical protein